MLKRIVAGMLKKSKINGLIRIICQNTGRVKLEKHYKNGCLHGKMVYYWDNGQVRVTGQYKEMRRIGQWLTYDYKGNLIFEENYDGEEQLYFGQLSLSAV